MVGASGTYFTRIFHKMVGFHRDSYYAHGSHACWIAGSWNPTDERFCSLITFKEVCTVSPWVSFVVRGDFLICPTHSIVLLGPYHLFLGAPKSLQMVTAAIKLKDACSFFGRKAMINLDSILKSRDIALPTKVCLVKAMVFPVVMYGCESWTIVRAEHWRIDAFELWCWRRLQGDPPSQS